MDRLLAIEQTRFLGREFLLWLWFSSEEQNSTLTLDDGTEIELFLDDRIVMEPVHGEGNRHQLSGQDPATSPEAAVALRMNKIPTEVKMKIVRQAQAWAFSLRGDDLQIRSLKIPDVLSDGGDEKVAERIFLMEEVETMLGALWRSFLLERTGEDWSQRLREIQAWIDEKFHATPIS
ncbi:MAG: hypothetical protein H6727_02980 [Myxococcales bacterium]|nr:hypothetical protein [Myxococcales bacterium]